MIHLQASRVPFNAKYDVKDVGEVTVYPFSFPRAD